MATKAPRAKSWIRRTGQAVPHFPLRMAIHLARVIGDMERFAIKLRSHALCTVIWSGPEGTAYTAMQLLQLRAEVTREGSECS